MPKRRPRLCWKTVLTERRSQRTHTPPNRICPTARPAYDLVNAIGLAADRHNGRLPFFAVFSDREKAIAKVL
jgi:hypothetical protein